VTLTFSCHLLKTSLSHVLKQTGSCPNVFLSLQDLLLFPQYLAHSFERDIGPRTAFVRSRGARVAMPRQEAAPAALGLAAVLTASDAELCARLGAQEAELASFRDEWQRAAAVKWTRLPSRALPKKAGAPSERSQRARSVFATPRVVPPEVEGLCAA
jgi:hypothetical protein